MPESAARSPLYHLTGRCRGKPRVTLRSGSPFVLFDLEDAGSADVVEVLAAAPDAVDPDEFTTWIGTLTSARRVTVAGHFTTGEGREVSDQPLRLIAVTVTPDGMQAGRSGERTLRLWKGVLKPMVPHRGGFAIAFTGWSESGDIDVVLPVAPETTDSEIAALSGRISRGRGITLTGTFRPSAIRQGAVGRWGFVASGVAIEDPPPQRLHDRTSDRRSRTAIAPPAVPPQAGPARPPASTPKAAKRILDDLTAEEAGRLSRCPLSAGWFKPQMRSLLERLDCRTLLDVARLPASAILDEAGYGSKTLDHCRRVLHTFRPRRRERTTSPRRV